MSDRVTLALGILTLLSVVFGWLRWARPRVRGFFHQTSAIRDSILGREAVHDSITGKELAPALPGVGVRLAATEQHLGVLAHAVETIAQSHARLENHEERIMRLEAASVERVVARAESAQAWAAVEAAAMANPPRDPKDKQ